MYSDRRLSNELKKFSRNLFHLSNRLTDISLFIHLFSLFAMIYLDNKFLSPATNRSGFVFELFYNGAVSTGPTERVTLHLILLSTVV